MVSNFNSYPGSGDDNSGRPGSRPYNQGPPDEESGQADQGKYRYTRDQLHRSDYTDAGYIPEKEAPSILPRHYYVPSDSQPRPKRKKGEKRRPGWAGVIAMCLICAVLGGGAGGLLTRGLNTGPGGESFAVPQLTDQPRETSDAALAPSPSAPLASNIGAQEQLSGSDIYRLGCPQTVGVSIEGTTTNVFGQPSSYSVTGSGFIIRSDGYIATNYHVIEAAALGGLSITVMLYDGSSYEATLVGHEADNDIAVLKIDADNLPAVSFGDSDSMMVGEAVYAIGNPLGELSYTMTSGMISALDREISTDESQSITINMFQFDAAVNSGNSGGPVFNSRGEAIGIVTAKYSSTGVEGIGFAIPINDGVTIMNELIEKGYISGKASFGILVQTVSSSVVAQYYEMPQGAYVYSIAPGSCSEKAGLHVGDIITMLEDVEILSRQDLAAAKKQYRAGDTVELTVFRSGKYLEINLTFDEEVPAQAQGQAA